MQLSRGPFEVRLNSLESIREANPTETQPGSVHEAFPISDHPRYQSTSTNLAHETQLDSPSHHVDELLRHDIQRNFDCENYETCLGLAAALNWDSFTCGTCDRKVNPQLLWRAHQNLRNDRSLTEICDLPQIKKLVGK